VLAHHADVPSDDPVSLNIILSIADYLTYTVDLGFLAVPPTPPQHILELYGCADEDTQSQVGEQLCQALEEERTLLRLGSH